MTAIRVVLGGVIVFVTASTLLAQAPQGVDEPPPAQPAPSQEAAPLPAEELDQPADETPEANDSNGVRRIGGGDRPRTNTGVEGIERIGPRGPTPGRRIPSSRQVTIDGVVIEQIGIDPAPLSPVGRPAGRPLPPSGVVMGPEGVTYEPMTGQLTTPNAVFNVRTHRVTVYQTQPNGFRVRQRVPYNPYSGAFDTNGVSFDPFSGIFRDQRGRVTFNVHTGDLMVFRRNLVDVTFEPVRMNVYRRGR